MIVTEGLRKRYGETEALAGLDLTVPAGTVHGLLGPNGAGKTTAVRILATLIRPDGGRAEVAGYDVASQPERVRYHIGLVGQHAAVDELLSGRQNLALFGRLYHLRGPAADRRADELLERFGLADSGRKAVKQYSGGMRRRLDLAASLILSPPVLFLDEPTTGLDPRGRIELWDAIRQLVGQGTDVLLTTQYLDEADQLASRIAIVDHGRVIAEGTPRELKQRIGRSVIDVHVRRPEDVRRAAAALARLDHGVTTTDDATRRVSVPVEAGADRLRDALDALESAGAEVEDVSLRQPTLDEVFLTLTGAVASTTGEE